MPKVVHDLVDKLLAKKDFYPGDKDRESKAWAIAYKQVGGKKSNRYVSVLRCANALDEIGYYKEADELTKIAQHYPSYMNEAGEPIMDAAAWRREQEADSEREYDPDDYLPDRDNGDFEEEEPGYYDPTPQMYNAIKTVLGDNPEPAFKPGWKWYFSDVDHEFQFSNNEDAQKVMDAFVQIGLKEGYDYDVVSVPSRKVHGERETRIRMPEMESEAASDNPEDYQREDFGWFGEMGMRED